MNSAELLLSLVPGNVVFYSKQSDRPKSNNLDGDIFITKPQKQALIGWRCTTDVVVHNSANGHADDFTGVWLLKAKPSKEARCEKISHLQLP